MNVLPTGLPEVLVIEPRVFADTRGFFLETYSEQRYADAGVAGPFVQDNHSRSAADVLRGLHFQVRRPQGKLIRCVTGAVFDVAVDIRRGSPTFGRWVGVELSGENRKQLWVPPGFAHGFCVVRGPADIEYKCTDYYVPDDESGVLWCDPTVGIAWPTARPVVSTRDAALPPLAPDRSDLPRYHAARS